MKTSDFICYVVLGIPAEFIDELCDDFHTEARTDGRWQVSSSKGYGCDANPKNVAAWAALMIEKGLVKSIYNDVY